MILRQIWQGCSPKLIVLLNHFLAAISLMIYCLYLHGLKFMLMFAYALCALTNNRNISLSYCRNQLKIFNHAFSRWVMNFIAFDRMLLKSVNRWKSTFPACICGDRIAPPPPQKNYSGANDVISMPVFRVLCNIQPIVPSTLRRKSFTLNTHKMYENHTTPEEFKDVRSNQWSFWICLWGKLGWGNHVIIVTSSFLKISVFVTD